MPPVIIPAKAAPTTSETSALAALVPAATACSKSTTVVLDEVLSLCRNEDVVSFLFAEDNIQLPYLTSPSLFSSAVTGTLTFTRVEPDQSRACKLGPLSDFVTGKWVFVPAFAVNGVTLGFGMHEFNYSQGDAWGADYMMQMRVEFRFVRNDAKGELLVVMDIPDMNACCMEYSKTVTPTCQSRTSICLNRDKLRHAAKSGFLDRTNIVTALCQIHTIYEYRNCPTCHRSHTQCLCTLQIARARHPFDHATFVKNMAQRLGTFEGVQSVFCYDDGRFKRKSQLGSRVTMRGGIDLDLITSMRDWALALHMKGTETPLQSITAPPTAEIDESTRPSLEETQEIDLSLDQYTESASFWLGDDDPFSELMPLDGMEQELLGSSSMVEALNWELPKGQPVEPIEALDEFNEQPVEARKDMPLLDLVGTAAVASEGSSTGTRASGHDVDLVKLLKAEMRRKRNRESAHRSNMKKKAINDKLKLDLKTSKEKAGALRMQESALRQENMRLRRMLSESAT